MDMRFGVNTTVENNPDSVVVEEPSADVDVVTMVIMEIQSQQRSIGRCNSECTVRDTCDQQQ